jgi:hypothetical protein
LPHRPLPDKDRVPKAPDTYMVSFDPGPEHRSP